MLFPLASKAQDASLTGLEFCSSKRCLGFSSESTMIDLGTEAEIFVLVEDVNEVDENGVERVVTLWVPYGANNSVSVFHIERDESGQMSLVSHTDGAVYSQLDASQAGVAGKPLPL